MKSKNESAKSKRPRKDQQYFVYVIRLDDEVLQKKKFREANPNYKEGKPCYYVGYSSKPPNERAEEHRTAKRNKRGRLYSQIAHNFFVGLRPSKYKRYNPLPTQEKAKARERQLAEDLRSKGYGVWSK